MASTAFEKALAKRKQTRSLMKKAREAERPDFSMPKIEDGSYIARVKGKTGVTPNKGVPFVELRWVIAEGEYKGKGWRMTYFLEGRDLEQEERTWASLGSALKTLSTRDDVESWEIEDLDPIIKEITEDAPLCRISLKNWKGEKSEGINCYFNEYIDETDEAEAIEVDDYVIYDDGDGDEEYVVLKVNTKRQTATIKKDDDDVELTVKLADLELSNS